MSRKTDKPKVTEAEKPQVAESWVCYWQDDSSPVPQIKVELKNVSKLDAEAWLTQVKASAHWTPKIADRTKLKA